MQRGRNLYRVLNSLIFKGWGFKTMKNMKCSDSSLVIGHRRFEIIILIQKGPEKIKGGYSPDWEVAALKP